MQKFKNMTLTKTVLFGFHPVSTERYRFKTLSTYNIQRFLIFSRTLI